MNEQDVVEAIRMGQCDTYIGQITKALRERRDALDMLKRYNLQVGDRVKMNERCHPQYLIGTRGTIVGKKRVKVIVRFENAPGHRWQGDVTCPTSILTKIEKHEAPGA